MSTLTLKTEAKANPKLDQIIEQNNVLIEQNKKIIELLSKKQTKTKPKQTPEQLAESLLKHFTPGNNYNAMIQLIRYLPRLNDHTSIRNELTKKGLKSQHMKLFDNAVNNLK